MNQGHLVLFAIPVICILVIAFTQFRDEMFKKRFILERRARTSNSQHPEHNRRYNDPKNPGAQPETTPERSAAAGTSSLEASGIRRETPLA
jgi:hypothetical protein